MHAPDRAALRVEGDVALGHARVQAVRLELAHAERAGEEAAVVRPAFGPDEHEPDRSEREDLGITCTVGMGMTNCPPQVRMCAICATISRLRFQGNTSR